VDTFSRLTRVAIMRNTALEELVADWRDRSVVELRTLRADVARLVEASGLPADERERLAAEIEVRFDASRFPFRHDRHVPRITVAGAVAEVSLEPGFRNPRPWTAEEKRHLIENGYALTDRELANHAPAQAPASRSF